MESLFSKSLVMTVIALIGAYNVSADTVVFSEDFEGAESIAYGSGATGNATRIISTNYTLSPLTTEGALVGMRRNGPGENGSLVQLFANGFIDISSENIAAGTEFSVSFDAGVPDAAMLGTILEVQLGYKVDGVDQTAVVLYSGETTDTNLNSLSGSAVLTGSGTITDIRPFFIFRRNNVLGTTVGSQINRIDSVWDNIEISAVPEPSSLALLGLGGLLIARRRRSA